MRLVHTVHIVGNDFKDPALCGSEHYHVYYVSLKEYMRNSNLTYWFYFSLSDNKYEWCQECVTHPDLVMARLNETNV